MNVQDKKELIRRAATAIPGVFVILGILGYGGQIGAGFFALVLSIGMTLEYSNMIFNLSDRAEKKGLLVGMTWLLAFFNFFIPREEFSLLLTFFFILFSYFLFTAGRHRDDRELNTHFVELMGSFFGLFYLGLLPVFLVLLAGMPNGSALAIYYLFMVWASDTGGYFSGKYFGKRKLYPVISPKKTVEGALGGFGLSLLISIVFKLTVIKNFGWLGILIIPGIVVIFAQVGDLCESFLKRAFSKKDSGSILPGHGGFLDRFDAVVFGLPVMYACVRIFN